MAVVNADWGADDVVGLVGISRGNRGSFGCA